MRLLRLLSRVAFICNICFLLASFIQWLPNPPEGEPVATVIVMGYLMSALFNIIVNLWVIVLLVVRRLRSAEVPRWLLIINFTFFMLQLSLLILNRK